MLPVPPPPATVGHAASGRGEAWALRIRAGPLANALEVELCTRLTVLPAALALLLSTGCFLMVAALASKTPGFVRTRPARTTAPV